MPKINRKVFDRYLTEADEKALFQKVDAIADIHARRDAAWMRLLRHTGMRVGELAGLTVEDARIALASQPKKLLLRPEICKGKKGRNVFLNRKAVSALQALLSIRREQGYPEIVDQSLIMSRKHQGMSVRSFQARFQHWCKEANLDVQASPHWMRHTLGKRIIKNSTASNPHAIAMHQLGHASLETTIIYTMPDKEEMQRALEEAA